MIKSFINLLIITCFINLHSEEIQTPWLKDTVQGFPVYNGKLEITEGFGAYIDYCLRPNTKNFDNGGGAYDFNSQYLNVYHGVNNYVYDPYKRHQNSNEAVLSEVKKHDFDTATSNSVLNVIDNKTARLKHIALSCEALKEGGIAYFKVYPGDLSSIEKKDKESYQSNRPAKSYQEEVEEIFGKGNVVVDVKKEMVVAYKNSACQKS